MRRRKGMPGDRQLRARTRGATSLPQTLPLVHTTAVFTAADILRGGKLETAECGVFGPRKQLLYFFVLRPAYRSRRGADPSEQLSRFPFVFVMRPEVGDRPYHVFPFDTGAGAAGAFADKADPLVYLEDYQLDPELSAASRLIEWGFGTCEAYYDGQLRNGVLDGVPDYDFVTRGYVDVARMGREGSNQHDTRASTVEVAVGHDVQLKDNVLLAIVPDRFLEAQAGPNGEIINRLKDLNIPYKTYKWLPNTAPDEYHAEIAKIARAWFRQEGWL